MRWKKIDNGKKYRVRWGFGDYRIAVCEGPFDNGRTNHLFVFFDGETRQTIRSRDVDRVHDEPLVKLGPGGDFVVEVKP